MATINDPKATPAPAQKSVPPTSIAPASTPAPSGPLGSATNPTHTITEAPGGAATPPERSAPDGTDPSRYPADGARLEGFVNGPAADTLAGQTPSAANLSGNPPPYNPDEAHGIVEVAAPSAGRLPTHMRLADFAIGKNCYKLGVSHPPYVIEAGDGKTFAVLRSGTGGTVHIANEADASFYTLDQSRQYAVADGNPNVSGDVKHP